MRALLLVLRGARLTAPLVNVLREKGHEPVVLSSAPADGGADFSAVCRDIGVEYHIGASDALTVDEVLERAPGCGFCFTISDNLRLPMAHGNQAVEAHDASPSAIQTALDKHLMRRALVEHGLSDIRPFLLTDPELRERLDRGERHIVKPRQGTASLCTRAVDSWAQASAQLAAFESGTGGDDRLAGYYRDNELIAETFFEGRELSFEMIRQDGRTAFASEHERTVLEFTDQTVLERGFASPPIWLSGAQVHTARALADKALDALELRDGCYHVELSVAADGRCELIEVNPRVGGYLLWDSVRLQYGRSLLDDWIDVLAGERVPAAGERRCGTYFQVHFLDPGSQVLASHKNRRLPEPEVFNQAFKPGTVARPDREELGAMTIWRTDLATHRDTVATLVPEEYCTFVYAKGRTGRPLFLVFEPAEQDHGLIEAADRDGSDVVVFHRQPLPDAVAGAGIAVVHQVESWEDAGRCLARVVEACAGATVVGTYAGQDATSELDTLVRDHFALPPTATERATDLDTEPAAAAQPAG